METVGVLTDHMLDITKFQQLGDSFVRVGWTKRLEDEISVALLFPRACNRNHSTFILCNLIITCFFIHKTQLFNEVPV